MLSEKANCKEDSKQTPAHENYVKEQLSKFEANLEPVGLGIGPTWSEDGYKFRQVRLPGDCNMLFVEDESTPQSAYAGIVISPYYGFSTDDPDEAIPMVGEYLECVMKDDTLEPEDHEEARDLQKRLRAHQVGAERLFTT